MAESFLRYKGWREEFDITDFSLIWIVIESVLDADVVHGNPSSLQGRLQEFINVNHLVEDWYHVTELDAVVAGDEQEFNKLLGKALWLVRQNYWQPEAFWASLRNTDWVVTMAARSRFAKDATLNAFFEVFTHFVLPALAPNAAHPVMESLGWNRINKEREGLADTCQHTVETG
ncbi:hypothetical protein [Brevifollis gellanilyticus]|uniref:Uncharacterized protein n=1 Tax=Brevifollis gellanilyticus TaxID=748831 RepID=A0A512MC20_9BACT|nr:hypothetical protein [Brevifollis gellanilyticus]GEP44275.1 hypothetical protein BGE01nite_35660 [Brevifollis gellanilyticus]